MITGGVKRAALFLKQRRRGLDGLRTGNFNDTDSAISGRRCNCGNGGVFHGISTQSAWNKRLLALPAPAPGFRCIFPTLGQYHQLAVVPIADALRADRLIVLEGQMNNSAVMGVHPAHSRRLSRATG